MSFQLNAEVIQKEYFNHYFVTLENGKSLRAVLRANSPIKKNGQVYYGKTQWTVDPNYRYKDYGSLCVVKETRVQLSIKFLLPKLHYTDTPSEEIKAQFEQFYEALYQHELGHKELGVKAANAVKDAMKSLEPFDNCQELRVAVQNKIQETIEKYKALNRQYDIDTNYGMTQGAVIKEVITVQ